LVSFVTNFQTSNRAVVRFYNQRATAEQRIKEGKQAVAMTQLSCHRFKANQVRLRLSLIVYNLGNLWRRLALPREIGNWSLTSLQQRLLKTGGRLIKTRPLLLVADCGESSDPAAVRRHAGEDRGAGVADGIEGGPSFADFGDESRGGTGVYESTGQTAFPEPAWPREARPTSFRPQSATPRIKNPA
jgi:hypothetical protein